MGSFAEKLRFSEKSSAFHPDIVGTLTGLDELDKVLFHMSTDLQKRMIRRAMKRALEPIEDAIERKTPKGKTGNLRDALMTRTSFKKVGGFFVGWVGYKRKPHGHHAHLIEWGTKDRTWEGMTIAGRWPIKPGKSMKAIPATWSLGRTRPQKNVTRVFKKWKRWPQLAFKNEMRIAIARAVKKAAKGK